MKENLIELSYIARPVVHDYAQFAMDKGHEIDKPVSYDPAKEIYKNIQTFLSLPDNWDGYGAIAPEFKTVINSNTFINQVPENYLNCFATEDISLTPYGTVILEWHNEQNQSVISFEIGNSEIGYYSETEDRDNPSSRGIKIDILNFNNAILPLFYKVFKNAVA